VPRGPEQPRESAQAAAATAAPLARSWRRSAPELLLVALALLLFARTVSYPFLFDDTSIVADNRHVESLSRIPEIFSSSYWEGTEVGNLGGLYRPVTILSYAIEHAVFGKNPAGYHVVNVLLHALVTVLVYRLFARLFAARTALIGAALFAVHPVHVEAVAGVVGRAELLSAALVLVALLLHVRSRPPVTGVGGVRGRGGAGGGERAGAGAGGAAAEGDARAGGGRATVWICAALYLVASLAKESSLAAIGLVAAYEITFRYGGRPALWARSLRRDAVRLYLPWILAALAALAMRYAALGFIAKADPLNAIDNPLIVAPVAARIPTALRIYAEYVRLALFPVRLAMDYSANQVPVSTWRDGPVWIGAALALLSAAGLAAAFVRRSRLLFPALWCVVTYALISNAAVLIGTVVAERLLYLPSAGFCVLFGAALASRPLRARRALAWAIPALAIGLLGARAWARTGDWRSEESVIAKDVRSAPQSARIRSAYGKQLYEAGRVPEALAAFDAAIAIAPHYGEPYLWKAFAATEAGDRMGAAQLYIKAIHRIPSYVADYEDSGRPALGLDLREAQRQYEAGIAAEKNKDFAKAAEAFGRVLELAPDPESARRLSAILLNMNRAEEALAWAGQAIAWEPKNGEAHWLASGAHFALGDWERSRAEAEEAERLGYDVPDEIMTRLRRGR